MRKNYQNSKYTSNQSFSYDKSCCWKDQILTCRKDINEETYFVCIIYNHCLYRKTVVNFENENNKVDSCVYFYVESFDKDHLISETYNNQLKKKSIPCQTTFNKRYTTSLPEELLSIRKEICFKKNFS